MRVTALVLVLTTAALLVGCGGAKKAAQDNGEASKPATRVFADAESAGQSASSLHIAGGGFSGGKPIRVDLSLGDKSAKGSISLGGLGFNLIGVANSIYIKGSDAFYKHFAGAGIAQLLHGKWLEIPASDKRFASISAFTSIGSFFKQIVSKHGKLVKVGLTTYQGQKVVEIRDTTKKSTLFVAATGKPYPVAAVKTRGNDKGTITFSDWSQSFSASAPKDAVAASQFGG